MARQSSVRLSPSAELKGLRGWERLGPQEQATIQSEYRAIADALRSEGQSRLAVGKHLLAVSEILAPRRLFVTFLRRHFHMARSTGYSYIDLWKAASQDAPKKVLDIAMSRNYRAVNRPEIFKTYPPPKTDNVKEIVKYLDRLETRKAKTITVHKSPENLLKQALHSVDACWNKVPAKSKSAWMRNLIGLELSKLGVNGEQVFEPLPIPEHFVVVRGRPKEKKAA